MKKILCPHCKEELTAFYEVVPHYFEYWYNEVSKKFERVDDSHADENEIVCKNCWGKINHELIDELTNWD